MKTFSEWLKQKNESITGIYPPLYSGLAAYPSLYINTYTPYIDASIKSKTIPANKTNLSNDFES